MYNDLISVVVTTYRRNYDKIEPTIISAFNQTYRNIELILVDDNSFGNDFQKEIAAGIQTLKRKYSIQYIPNTKNRGAQFSRNQGILTSKGNYIAFLDDDDLWEPEKIEKQIMLFDDIHVGLVYCKGWLVSSNEDEVIPYNMSENFCDRLDFNDLSYGDYIGTTSQVMIRKEVFAACGLFDLNQPARQDYEMWIRISQKYDCVGVKQYLFKHVKHEGEQITKNPLKAAVGMENIYHKYRKQSSFTAKWHISLLTAKAYRKASSLKKAAKYALHSIFYFLVAVIVDFKELNKRFNMHNARKISGG